MPILSLVPGKAGTDYDQELQGDSGGRSCRCRSRVVGAKISRGAEMKPEPPASEWAGPIINKASASPLTVHVRDCVAGAGGPWMPCHVGLCSAVSRRNRIGLRQASLTSHMTLLDHGRDRKTTCLRGFCDWASYLSTFQDKMLRKMKICSK